MTTVGTPAGRLPLLPTRFLLTCTSGGSRWKAQAPVGLAIHVGDQDGAPSRLLDVARPSPSCWHLGVSETEEGKSFQIHDNPKDVRASDEAAEALGGATGCGPGMAGGRGTHQAAASGGRPRHSLEQDGLREGTGARHRSHAPQET